MSYKFKLLALFTAAALTGCGAIPPRPSVSTPPLAPPAALVENCDLVPPPNVKLYSQSPPEKKEELLYTFSMAQMDSMVLCNKKKASLRLWISEQQRLHLLSTK